jgi:hypothetical protein
MKGTMAVMGVFGDQKIGWDSDVPNEVEAARKTFNELTKKGYFAFAIRGENKKGEQIKEFDPQAERLIMAPPVRGG